MTVTNPSNDWDDLDQFLGEVPEEDYEHPEALDADKANRMLRKLRRLQVSKADTEATANAEINRIAQWRDGRSQMIGGEIGRLEATLEGYMRAVNRLDPKCKTRNLPNGALRLRAPRTRVVVDAPELALNFVLHRVADERLTAPGTVATDRFRIIDSVLDALNAEPLLRLKLELAGSEIAKATSKGPERGVASLGGTSTDMANLYEAMLETGEPLPGVTLQSFAQDTFTLTLNVDDEPKAFGDDATPGDEL